MTTYGEGSTSYEEAGGRAGITRLVDAFYAHMDRLSQAATIRAMHDADLTLSREKLALFLCGWLGGPNLYATTFGAISIPRAHRHLPIGEAERDAWLACMDHAVDEQPWSAGFKRYFLRVIATPAERVRLAATTAAAATS